MLSPGGGANREREMERDKVMELRELQQHILTLTRLDLTAAPVVSWSTHWNQLDPMNAGKAAACST